KGYNMLKLDHLAVAGIALQDAELHSVAALGVPAAGHGVHPHFGTHNALWGMGAEFYLEAIAVDPDAPKPAYPRWFGLDDFTGPARLGTWILATDDMAATLDHLGPEFGQPVALQRGAYSWEIAVPTTGANGFDGFAPSIIQWHGDQHPAPNLGDSGLRFQSLNVQHPRIAELSDLLAPLLRDDRITFSQGAAGMSAQFTGPGGVVALT
ncbi:MAG: VOC family protein, partial [Planktomarina sp.]